MPKRYDLKRVLVVGPGPIAIGQACEFDYSGTQALRALKEEGLAVVLVNSNPATIMTDPEFADATYVEPLVPSVLEQIIERERPDALLPTVGGQTALNLTVRLHEAGVLEKYGVECLGAKVHAIKRAESRSEFRRAMLDAGLDVPNGAEVGSVEEARAWATDMGLPAVVRPSFTLGGEGGGLARTQEELHRLAQEGLDRSPVHTVLIEESLHGWKEFELEVMRDRADNAVVVCSIENVDAMGIHTGDSLTVAPALTLTDREYQRMRDAALRCLSAIGVETGGSNVQFAVNPDSGRMVIIEMNPRVSRSSALASKATGFPIARVATKLALGYTLDEIENAITRETLAAFEPALDYVVVKAPRFNFDKFPESDDTLTTRMKSVGEVMAIGGSFKEALQKALRSLEDGRSGFAFDGNDPDPGSVDWKARLSRPRPSRYRDLAGALHARVSVEELHGLTGIDLWFLREMEAIVKTANCLASSSIDRIEAATMRTIKAAGFSDRQLAYNLGTTEESVRELRSRLGVQPIFKTVDTCAAEFEAFTPYYYSTYDGEEDESFSAGKNRVVILGAGPNRIGQGIEFDYCCVRACMSLRKAGHEVVMINCNPETVSTDYDTADILYFEPVTLEDVLAVCRREEPLGVIVQLGGQTPLKLAASLDALGIPVLGTAVDKIALAEDRRAFQDTLAELNVLMPEARAAEQLDEACQMAAQVGYPVLVRPSYVLGGLGMAVVYDESDLRGCLGRNGPFGPSNPVELISFLEDAFEYDVDAVSDGKRTLIAGVMQHIQEAGIHSGDSACTIPPFHAPPGLMLHLRDITERLASRFEVRGLMNIQIAVKDNEVYVLEVNPRASRTLPFVSKATGVRWIELGTMAMVGQSLAECGVSSSPPVRRVAVKEAVFPFDRFPEADPALGPEMRSTGEVMGVDWDFGRAFAKSQLAGGFPLPTTPGLVFVSVHDRDKPAACRVTRRLHTLGFRICATSGTAAALREYGVPVEEVKKLGEGNPNALDYITSSENPVCLVLNTPLGKNSKVDDSYIRRAAIRHRVPYMTTLSAASAAVAGIEALLAGQLDVYCLQEFLPQDGRAR